MLFAVTMDVDLPVDMPGRADPLAAREGLQPGAPADGRWPHIWRIVGAYSNLHLRRRDNEALHDLLWNLPLFPYMTIEVTPFTDHPSAIG